MESRNQMQWVKAKRGKSLHLLSYI